MRKKEPRTRTTVMIRPEFQDKARIKGLNISQFLNDRLAEYFKEDVAKEDPFKIPEVKALLPQTAKALKKNPEYAQGRARLIYKKTGYYIEPDVLLKKLKIEV